VDQSLLTGESKPVEMGPGDEVIGGSINSEGSLTVEVRKGGRDSYIFQMVELVRRAQEGKTRTQDLADRAALALTLVALGGGVLTLAAWLLGGGKGLAFSLERSVTVMVIACPHALGLAIPLVVAVSTALAAKRGLLIRDRRVFEGAKDLRAVIFDKTGTLTEGVFRVTEVIPLDGQGEGEVLRLAATVEQHSEHPVARAIVEASEGAYPLEDFKALPGRGARGRVEGREVMVVGPAYLEELGLSASDPRVARAMEHGKTVVFLVVEGALKGAIALSDAIKPEAREAVQALRRMGVRCLMLTGDNPQAARWVAEELGIEEYFAQVKPHEKAQKVQEVQARGFPVAMTGDGVNDAPALAQADVGIAIGAGTDVAAEAADVILVRSNPLDVVAVIRLARATYHKMVQNLAWATGYNVLAIPLAAGVLYPWGVLLSPAVGAALMSVSTVIVAINARRLKMA